MFRADDADADPNANGTGKAGYTEGEPGVTAPTPVRADALNSIQEEICLAVEDGGLTLNKSVKRQLSQVMKVRAAKFVMGSSWTQQTVSGTPGTFNAGVWNTRTNVTGDRFIIVGDGGAIQTSPDGVTWTARTAAGGFTDPFYAATSRTDLAVIAGDSGQIQTSSTSGTTWTARSAAGSNTFNGAAYSESLDLFCLVGNAGTIETSPDGVTWTARTAAGSFTGTFNAVAWDPVTALFCAVGGNGVSTTPQIQTSPDGITWTQRTPATVANVELNSVSALPDAGGFLAAGNGTSIEFSDDGTTWSALTAAGMPAGTATMSTVQVAGCAVAYDYTNEKAAQITPDGDSLVAVYARGMQKDLTAINAIVSGYDQYLAVGSDGNGAVALSDVGGF